MSRFGLVLYFKAVDTIKHSKKCDYHFWIRSPSGLTGRPCFFFMQQVTTAPMVIKSTVSMKKAAMAQGTAKLLSST